MTALEAMVPQPGTQRPVQIPHANVHACSRSTLCDAFHDGANRRISNQETSNFTDEKATFTQKVTYAVAGEYNVFAHVVLPPKNVQNETYQFVTFTTTSISSNAAATSSAASSGSSTGTMIGVIVGAVVVLAVIVVGVIFYRRKKPDDMMAPGNDHFRSSAGGYSRSNTTKGKASRLDWNGDPEFQFGHDRYQASMVSEYSKQPAPLSASALMFQDGSASSRTGKQKTVSSNGSSHRSAGGSIRGGSAFDTYDDHRYPDNSTFATDMSMGTSNNGYAPYNPGASLGSGGLFPPPYGLDSGLGDAPPVSEYDRDSVASMGTVDFALPPPLPLPPAFSDLEDSGVRATGDSFLAEDVPNLASTKLAFNDEEISKQTIEYIDSLRQQNEQYGRDTDQASDYVSDFGDTSRTYDFRDSTQSDQVYGESFRNTDEQFTDTEFRQNKRTDSNTSESYEF
jgi:hypothetical protein